MKFIALVLSSLLLVSFIPSPQIKTPINWSKLDSLVLADTMLSSSNKIGYQMLQDIPDIDNARLKTLQKAPYYKYIENEILPKL